MSGIGRTVGSALSAMLVAAVFAPASRGEFALRDGDVVVFLGDSITAARTYGKIVENYTLLRFPDRKVRFVNSGWGGDTAAGGLKRLDRDVFDQGATVLIVAYGVNDIGWGTKADAEHKKIYLDAVRGIVTRCKERGVRVFICSAAVTGEDPSKSETGFLQGMCDEGMAVSRGLGEGSIDVQRAMRAIQRKVREAAATEKKEKEKPTLHAEDGIHLNDLGQTAMAFAILKGLGAPAEVSSATIDARGTAEVVARGCRISTLKTSAEGLEFDRRDEGSPLNFGLFGAFRYRFVPIPDELNRYMLTVKNLDEGRYEIRVDGRSLGKFEAERLARGVNLSSATADGWEPGGPWEAQAWSLSELTDARSEIAWSLRSLAHYLPDSPALGALRVQTAETNARLEALQRALVRPRAFHYVVRRVAKTNSNEPTR